MFVMLFFKFFFIFLFVLPYSDLFVFAFISFYFILPYLSVFLGETERVDQGGSGGGHELGGIGSGERVIRNYYMHKIYYH